MTYNNTSYSFEQLTPDYIAVSDSSNPASILTIDKENNFYISPIINGISYYDSATNNYKSITGDSGILVIICSRIIVRNTIYDGTNIEIVFFVDSKNASRITRI